MIEARDTAVAVGEPAVAVAGAFAVGGGPGGEGFCACGQRENGVGVECLIPAVEIVDGAVDATIAEYGGGVGLIGARPSGARARVAVDAICEGRIALSIGDGGAHAERGEDALFEELIEGDTAAGGDDFAEEGVARVAVVVGGAGRAEHTVGVLHEGEGVGVADLARL